MAHTQPNSREWWQEHTNLADLWVWLTDQGWQPADPLDFISEPWSWSEEYQQMVAGRRETSWAA